MRVSKRNGIGSSKGQQQYVNSNRMWLLGFGKEADQTNHCQQSGKGSLAMASF